jgi:hypothetical protein
MITYYSTLFSRTKHRDLYLKVFNKLDATHIAFNLSPNIIEFTKKPKPLRKWLWFLWAFQSKPFIFGSSQYDCSRCLHTVFLTI